MRWFKPAKNKKWAGFTLLECLVALLAIGLIFEMVYPVVRLNWRIEKKSRGTSQMEWHVFLNQLDYELREARLAEVATGNNWSLAFKHPVKDFQIIYSEEKKVLRKKQDGGYVLLLMDVEKAQFNLVPGGFKLQIELSGQASYEAFVATELLSGRDVP